MSTNEEMRGQLSKGAAARGESEAAEKKVKKTRAHGKPHRLMKRVEYYCYWRDSVQISFFLDCCVQRAVGSDSR